MHKIKTANRLENENEIYSMTNKDSTYSMGWKKSKEVTYNNFTQVLKTGKYLWFSQG